jgi:galactokinase
LIGDHTDYTGGLVCPIAIDRWTEVRGRRTGDGVVRLSSDSEPEPAVVGPHDDPATLLPVWARYVAAVRQEVGTATGFDGHVSSTVPAGVGLSSSAALEVAVAIALGITGDARAVALACQRAEQTATGTPTGVMDQLASAAGLAGHALLIDCTTLDVDPVPLPPGAAVVVVPSGTTRTVAGSAYAERAAQCAAAEALVGPLRSASLDAVAGIADMTVRARARHVVTENERVRQFVIALRAGDVATAGRLMTESHNSLRDDYEVSTPALDSTVARLLATPGVHGARLSGAGFGGCVVALTEPGALAEGFVVHAVDGALR